MFPLAKTILQGRPAARRMPRGPLQARFRDAQLDADDPAERRRQAEAVVRPVRGEQREVAEVDHRRSWDGETASLTYEDVDTSLIPPRPRLYGWSGRDIIEEVWKERQAAKTNAEIDHGERLTPVVHCPAGERLPPDKIIRSTGLRFMAESANNGDIASAVTVTHVVEHFEVRVLRQDGPGAAELLGTRIAFTTSRT